jgi:uncharacterized protein YbjT (DUF2867 family)
MAKILVTGATGTNGKALINKLHALQADFVIATRKPNQANDLFKDSQIVTFDFANQSTYENAVKDIDRVFLLGPPLTLKVDELMIPFIDFLNEKGIKRVVYLSALKSDKMGVDIDFHQKIEQKLKKEEFDYTILKPSFFAQNFKNYDYENISERGIIYSVAGKGKVAFVDVLDIANVAANVLLHDGHSKKTYELTGTESFSFEDVASILSEILDKKIIYPNPSAAEFREVLLLAGAPEFIVTYLINVYSIIANNEIDITRNDIETVTGKKPTSFKEVLQRDFK